jgi:hypothetical protein
MIEFVPASPAHVGTLAARMRQIDRLECRIMGHSPKEALRMCLRYSTLAYTAKVDGRAEAMFGVSAVSLLAGEGSPWLLMTDDAIRQAKSLVRDARRYSDLMQCVFPVLRNHVHADNHVAIRWLQRLGYGIGDVIDMNGHPMRLFERRKGQRCLNRLPC